MSEVLEAPACYAARRSATSMYWRRARTTTERAAGIARGSLIGSTSPSAVPVYRVGSFSAVEPKMTDGDIETSMSRSHTEVTGESRTRWRLACEGSMKLG